MQRAGKHLSLAAALTAGIIAIAGCGSDNNATTASSALTSPSTTTLVTTDTPPTPTTQAGVTAPDDGDIGSEQEVVTDSFTAHFTVKNEPKLIVREDGSRTVTFPVVITVDTGKLTASPRHWRLVTHSGQMIPGNDATGLPTALGKADITTTAGGLLPFSDRILTDDVALARIEYRADSSGDSERPTVQWQFPTPIVVATVPTTTEK